MRGMLQPPIASQATNAKMTGPVMPSCVIRGRLGKVWVGRWGHCGFGSLRERFDNLLLVCDPKTLTTPGLAAGLRGWPRCFGY